MITSKFKKIVKSKKWLGLVLPIGLIIIWQLASDFGFINASLLPSPSRIWQALVKQALSGKLAVNIIVSLRRVLVGYALGAFLGIIIGIITFIISLIGVKIGNKFGTKYGNKAEMIGGLILIFIGMKILIQHTVFN